MSLGVLTFGLAQAVLLFWWAARYPGLFSPDSLDHVWQATTGNWNTHHPISYTALVWLSVELTGGIGALTLAQTTALAAGLAYAVTGLLRLGGPAWGWTTAAVVVVALPPVGTFAVCVWKDVPFVVCHVLLLGTVARLLAHRRPHAAGGRWEARNGPVEVRPDRRRRLPRDLLAALVAELTLVCLFRQNGFVVVAIVTVLLALLLRRGAVIRLLLAGVLAGTVALLTNWALLPALGVRDSESIVAYEAMIADLAVGYAKHPAEFSAADLALLTRLAPPAHWRQSADCYTVDSTVYHPDFDRAAAAAHTDELLSAWWRLVRRSPQTVLDARLCRGSIAWRPTPAGGLRANPTAWALPIYLERDPRFQRPEVLAVAYSRPLGERTAEVADLLASRVGQPEWLLWRGATWAYLAYLTVGLLAWRRRNPALLGLAALSLGNQLSVLAVNNAQAARYMAAPYVLGVLLLPLLGARDPDRPGVATGRNAGRASDDRAERGGHPPLQVTELTVVAGPAVAGPSAQPDPARRPDLAGRVDGAEPPAPPFGPADWWVDPSQRPVDRRRTAG
ncbi:hypothetical protein O7626_05590 [Micromonospora sp. WMMD1102]|uniref:DUF6020 family protein n=1 Tax=Micromonospora sp. WMMD1102 TaxID=3016105 RepID=UPI002414DC1F|nr:DUF6020 family protein [Micromonospora sp. WMMD1102]MDG4785410.1 hypothetical protein [Micromonospora sp. WMMD1102]